MKIHSTTLIYESLPSIYQLLESTVFMWFVLLLTIVIICWCLAKLWHVHSLPKYLAKEKGLAQAKLIFWLCILGLAWKPLWIIAVLSIVTDWDKVQDWLKGIKS